MEAVLSSPPPDAADFESVALPFLPNVARYAQLLTRDVADSEDLTQETFMRAHAAWRTFQGGDCRKWLFAICRNVYLRDRQRSQRFVGSENPEQELRLTRDLYDDAYNRGLRDLLDRIDLRPALQAGLAQLHPEYQQAVMLVDVEDQSYAAAAASAGVPIGTIRSRLFRARRLLQQALIEHARDSGLATAAVAGA